MSKPIEIWIVKWTEIEEDKYEKETYKHDKEERFFSEDAAEDFYNEIEDETYVRNPRIDKIWGDAEDYEIRDDSIEA